MPSDEFNDAPKFRLWPTRLRWKIVFLLLLSILAYAPALSLPFIDHDDYVEIPLAGRMVAGGLSSLWTEPGLRARALHMLLNGALVRIFGFTPLPFYVTSILLHGCCVLLTFYLLMASDLDQNSSFLGAGFFAIQDGHQEAVMWISARSELLMFFFCVEAWLAWDRYLAQQRRLWYVVALGAYMVAATCKESFFIFPALMLLRLITVPAESRRRLIVSIIPFFGISIVYVYWTWMTRVAQSPSADDRFVVMAPFARTMLRSWVRLMFPWGLVAMLTLLWLGHRAEWRRSAWAISWMLLAIFPYSFLTYMPQLASRHTYLASAGLAALVGVAARLLSLHRPRVLAVLTAAALIINLEILWVKKLSQFRERAEPAVMLRNVAADAIGPVTIRCIPYSRGTAEKVLALSGASARFDDSLRQDDHCFTVEYNDKRLGEVRIDRRIRTATHGAFF